MGKIDREREAERSIFEIGIIKKRSNDRLEGELDKI